MGRDTHCGEGACSRWAAKQPPLKARSINLIHRVARFQGRFAPQREQAPSPQWFFPIPQTTNVAHADTSSNTAMARLNRLMATAERQNLAAPRPR